MNKLVWAVLSATVMALTLAACSGGNAGDKESEPPGVGATLPGGLGAGAPLPGAIQAIARAELHYGDVVQVRSLQSDLCLAAQNSAYAFPMVIAVPQCQATQPWKFVDPANPTSTARIKFNDVVGLYSPSWNGYLLPDWGDQVRVWMGQYIFELRLQDPSNLNSTADVTFGVPAVVTQAWGCWGCTAFLSSGGQGQPREAQMRLVVGTAAERWVIRQAGAPFAYWMTEMASALHDVPLTKLAIPGSHDAGTYSIADDAPFSPDLPLDDLPKLKELLLGNPTFAPQVNAFMARFARAQSRSITEQLNTGVRYFDLRPGASNNGNGDELLIVHSLYGGNILDMIDDVATFLTTHPKEVVILDISHFTAMSDRHHTTLMSHIKTAFGQKLVPPPSAASTINPKADGYTMGDIQDGGRQVVLIYQDDHAAGDSSLWRYGTPTSTKWWPFKPTTGQVKAVLEDRLRNDRPQLPGGSFFVLQTVLTPDEAYYSRVFFALVTPKDVMESTVKTATDKITTLEGAIQGRQGDIVWLDEQIKARRADIAEWKRWIDNHPYFWDYVGRKSREGLIALAQLEISGFEATKSTEKSSIDSARTSLADAKTKLAEFLQLYADAVATPGTLVELAEQSNAEMSGWLPGWRDRHLNIVIQDAVSEDFVDAVTRLNK